MRTETHNETKHTPGPWRVGDAGDTVFSPKMSDGSLPVIVANCDYQQTRAGGSKKCNARLIAAAPELLEACKSFRDSDVNAWKMAVAAIAKAEGGGRK